MQSKVVFDHFDIFLHYSYLCVDVVYPSYHISLKIIEFIDDVRYGTVDSWKHFEHFIKLLARYCISWWRNRIWGLYCFSGSFMSRFHLDLFFLRFAVLKIFGKNIWLFVFNAIFVIFRLVWIAFLSIVMVFKVFV